MGFFFKTKMKIVFFGENTERLVFFLADNARDVL